MHLLSKILHILNGSQIYLFKNIRLSTNPINVNVLFFNRTQWAILILLISVGSFGISCSHATPDRNITTIEALAPRATNDLTAEVNKVPEKHIVTIKDMKYNPTATRAQMGDTILFVNKDLVPHNVADSLNKEWLSPQINFGEEWSMTVTGNLHFYCAFHPNMEGDIIIDASMSAQKSK